MTPMTFEDVLADYNCIIKGLLKVSKDGVMPDFAIQANFVTGESEEDRGARAQKCKEALVEGEHLKDLDVVTFLDGRIVKKEADAD